MILDLEDPDGGQEKLGQICAIFTVQPKNYEDRQEVQCILVFQQKQSMFYYILFKNCSEWNCSQVYCRFCDGDNVALQYMQVSKRAAAGKKGQTPKEPGKGQLWDGLVSIILVEGKKMIPMDDSGGCIRGLFTPL